MAKILMLYPDLPSRTKAAGHKTSFEIIRALSDQGHEIHILSFDSTGVLESDVNELRTLSRSLKIFPLRFWNKLFNALLSLLFFRVPFIGSRISEPFKQAVDQYLDAVDYVHIEYSQMIYYIKYVKKSSVNVSFLSHDVIAQKTYREMESHYFLNPMRNVNWLLTRQNEKHFLSYSDVILVQNRKDASLVKDINTKIRIIVPYVAISKTTTITSPINKRYIIFFGAMNRKENIVAVKAFIKNCWDELRKQYNDLFFYVIGNNPDKSLLRISGTKNVVVTGFVDDPFPLISGALAAVAPLTLGAGIKVKVLESLRTGCPVVAFPAGAEGIDIKENDGLITVNSFMEMNKRLMKIIDGIQVYNKHSVRAAVESAFDWNITCRFLSLYYK